MFNLVAVSVFRRHKAFKFFSNNRSTLVEVSVMSYSSSGNAAAKFSDWIYHRPLDMRCTGVNMP